MAKFRVTAGAELDVLTQDELDKSLESYGDRLERARVRGIRYRRLPLLQGAAAGGVLTLGQNAPTIGPDSGFAWSLRRLVVTGLTAGTTPDLVNLYRNGSGEQPVWQFNGNNFGYTFGRLEIVVLGGETLVLQSAGTFAAAGTITLSGELVELPAEMLGKLA